MTDLRDALLVRARRLRAQGALHDAASSPSSSTTRLWPRVWQIACREEQVAAPGDFVEYDDRRRVRRRSCATEAGALHAFYNACLHRGRRLAEGCGSFADGAIRCPYHGWCYALDGRLVDVPDRDEFAGLPDDLALAPVRGRHAGAGSCSSTSTPTPSRCSTSSIRCPTLLAPYHLEQMRLRASLSTIIDANWKAVVDAFNEGYHVQGLHPQILPWTDDVEHRVRAVRNGTRTTAGCPARAASCGRARASASQPDEYDEGEILASLVAGLGGAFLGEERAAVEALRATGPPPGLDAARGVPGAADAAARRARLRRLGPHARAHDERRRRVLLPQRRRPDLSRGARSSSACARTATIPTVRSRTRGCSSGARPARSGRCPTRPKFYADWRERNWGEITEQDYENLANVQRACSPRAGPAPA